MNRTINLPGSVSSRVIELVMERAGSLRSGDTVSLDMSEVRFVDPAGMVCLLELIRYFDQEEVTVRISEPEGDAMSYLRRMKFWTHVHGLIRETDTGRKRGKGGRSDVLLEITDVRESRDIHRVLGDIRHRAGDILKTYLHYPESELDRFLTSISEICQNIVEHSEDMGYVAVQKYHYQETLGKNVVKMVVSDLGIGIRSSLEDKLQEKFGEEWGDRVAIEQALYKSMSRFHDPGRGHGLTSVRKSTKIWNGLLTLRSGTARVSIVPDWNNTPEREEGLPHFPGTQVILMLPEKEQEEEPAQQSLF